MTETIAQIDAEPRARTRTLANYIGGAWVVPAVAETLSDRDPATGETLAEVPLSGPAELDAAVKAARAAQPGWRSTSPIQRMRAVFRIRETLLAHQDEIARLVTQDMGKTLDDARAEVGRGIESCEAACGALQMLKGETLEGVGTGVDVESILQPVGVVAAITPFNFPAMIPLWFLPYAVVCGNAFILKPSERDPLPSERIFELLSSIDELPDGVINLVHGGRDAVNAILDHPGIDAVSFVGQAATARYVMSRGIGNGKRVQALGGAKNAIVVMPDADPGLMASGVCASAFGAAGQRCLAGSLAILVGSGEEQERSRRLILDAAGQLRSGAGADPATDVCPVVSREAREHLAQAIGEAQERGVKIALDGRGDPGPGGANLGPTIFEHPPEDDPVVRDELFGPILTLLRAQTLTEAIEVVNGSRYGNASVIFTSAGGAAREFRYGVQAGMIGVNVGVAAPVAWFPFSGWKDSIDGDLHANGSDAISFYTRKKVVTSRWA
jgi:malonate-semialdehyde dehydrogenase (acetylating)/methylmalonate-semialdehyde dehydrogenase